MMADDRRRSSNTATSVTSSVTTLAMTHTSAVNPDNIFSGDDHCSKTTYTLSLVPNPSGNERWDHQYTVDDALVTLSVQPTSPQ